MGLILGMSAGPPPPPPPYHTLHTHRRTHTRPWAQVASVLCVGRRPCGEPSNPKLRELVHGDFSDFSLAAEELKVLNCPIQVLETLMK